MNDESCAETMHEKSQHLFLYMQISNVKYGVANKVLTTLSRMLVQRIFGAEYQVYAISGLLPRRLPAENLFSGAGSP